MSRGLTSVPLRGGAGDVGVGSVSGGVFSPSETEPRGPIAAITTTCVSGDASEHAPASEAWLPRGGCPSNESDGEVVCEMHHDPLLHLPHAIEEGELTSAEESVLTTKTERRSSKRLNSASVSDPSKVRSTLSMEFSTFKARARGQNGVSFGDLDVSKLPNLPSYHGIKVLRGEDVSELVLSYLSTELPGVDTMFPWLHGLHPSNYGQINFFMSKQQDDKPRIIPFGRPERVPMEGELGDDSSLFETPPTIKFLMPVRSCNTRGENSIEFTNPIVESTGLIKGSIAPHDVLVPLSHVANVANYLTNSLPPFIFNVIPFDIILQDCMTTQLLPEFHNLDPKTGINLRNFHIQVSKLSHVSDFLVYCFNADHKLAVAQGSPPSNSNCKCGSLSRLLHLAQLIYQFQHPELELEPNAKRHNTLVVTNLDECELSASQVMAIENINAETALKGEDELCSTYDVHVFHNWDANYLYRERLEISKMSSATPLNNNVWLGNITDFECLQIKLNTNQHVDNPSHQDQLDLIQTFANLPNYTNFNKSSIVRLAKPQFKGKSHRQIDELLINSPPAHWKLFIFCSERAKIPTLAELEPIFENLPKLDLVTLQFPVSGSLSLVDLSIDNILSIVNICKLLYYKCSSDPSFPCLVYCSDGYTESSLFALFYIIFSFGISIDEAILKLHREYGRPFFIFKSDYGLLIKLEGILTKFSPLNNPGKDLTFENDKSAIRTLLLKPNRSRSNSTVGGAISTGGITSFSTSTGHHVVQLRGFQNSNSGASSGGGIGAVGAVGAVGTTSVGSFGINQFNDIRYAQRGQIADTPMLPLSQIDISGSFATIDGSLPSLILPHMYLGSLDHALCIPMLARLGIDYVVSVGERVAWINDLKYDRIETPSGCEVITIHPGQKLVGSSYEITVKRIIRFQNLNDDGIGTLTDTIDDALNFIDECYRAGGKVLVHCQVGVSRSATVCIAETMKRLNVSLPRAYMYVRVRRLNVIIQPNLKLMYELFKWEEKYHRRQAAVGSQVISNVPATREVDWHVLCREIYNLNKNYIR